MNLISIIEDVGHSFIELSGKVIYLTPKGLCKISGEDFILSFENRIDSIGIFSNNEFIIGHGFDSKIINIQTKIIEDFPYMVKNFNNLKSICSNFINELRYTSSILKDGNVQWSKIFNPGKFSLLLDKYYINSKFLDDTKISSFNSNTGEEFWTFDTTTLGTWIDYDKREQETAVRRVIGELDGRLYIYLNSGKILVLDVETGDILKKLVNDKYVSEHWFNGNFGYFIEIDRQNKKLIQLAQQSYTEVNLATYEVTQIDLKESMPINLENDHNIVFDETHIYFSDRYNCKLASLNRTTMQIDWVHQLSDPKTCEIDGNRHGKDLKLYGNRLYVLDNKSTLHIFEKENV